MIEVGELSFSDMLDNIVDALAVFIENGRGELSPLEYYQTIANFDTTYILAMPHKDIVSALLTSNVQWEDGTIIEVRGHDEWDSVGTFFTHMLIDQSNKHLHSRINSRLYNTYKESFSGDLDSAGELQFDEFFQDTLQAVVLELQHKKRKIKNGTHTVLWLVRGVFFDACHELGCEDILSAVLSSSLEWDDVIDYWSSDATVNQVIESMLVDALTKSYKVAMEGDGALNPLEHTTEDTTEDLDDGDDDDEQEDFIEEDEDADNESDDDE